MYSEYDDYSIYGAFKNRKKAEKFCETANNCHVVSLEFLDNVIYEKYKVAEVRAYIEHDKNIEASDIEIEIFNHNTITHNKSLYKRSLSYSTLTGTDVIYFEKIFHHTVEDTECIGVAHNICIEVYNFCKELEKTCNVYSDEFYNKLLEQFKDTIP